LHLGEDAVLNFPGGMSTKPTDKIHPATKPTLPAKTTRKRKTKSADQSIDEHNEVCSICTAGGDLLLCDGCNQAFHLLCLTPALDSVPEGNWACQECESDIQKAFGQAASKDEPRDGRVLPVPGEMVLYQLNGRMQKSHVLSIKKEWFRVRVEEDDDLCYVKITAENKGIVWAFGGKSTQEPASSPRQKPHKKPRQVQAEKVKREAHQRKLPNPQKHWTTDEELSSGLEGFKTNWWATRNKARYFANGRRVIGRKDSLEQWHAFDSAAQASAFVGLSDTAVASLLGGRREGGSSKHGITAGWEFKGGIENNAQQVENTGAGGVAAEAAGGRAFTATEDSKAESSSFHGRSGRNRKFERGVGGLDSSKRLVGKPAHALWEGKWLNVRIEHVQEGGEGIDTMYEVSEPTARGIVWEVDGDGIKIMEGDEITALQEGSERSAETHQDRCSPKTILALDEIALEESTRANVGCTICCSSNAAFMPVGCDHTSNRGCESCLSRLRACPFCRKGYTALVNVVTQEVIHLKAGDVHCNTDALADGGNLAEEADTQATEFDMAVRCDECGGIDTAGEDSDATNFILLCDAVTHERNGSSDWRPCVQNGQYVPCPKGTHIGCCPIRPWPVDQVKSSRDAETAGDWFCRQCEAEHRSGGYPLVLGQDLPDPVAFLSQ
jgi:hypothetical protein